MNLRLPHEKMPITSIALVYERDVVVARQQVRKISELVGFGQQDQIRLATSVSEIARNAYQYARNGRVEIDAATGAEPCLLITVSDQGPGISNLDSILSGKYKSRTGLGNGIIGTQRLMDVFHIESAATGTTVVFGKKFPASNLPISQEQIDTVRAELARQVPDDPFYELQRQNQELMRTLDELRTRQIQMAQLNDELEATNRGVVALYAELDERANYLRRTNELKTQFLSNMTHEFRTPLHSIRMLAAMVLDRVDGPLTAEQEKQMTYILHGAEELSGFVDNLLDLAKVEAGRLTLRLQSFDLHSIFDVLKGMLKPLTKESKVSLIFDEPDIEVHLFSDEGKVSQILRNFISNALKFTTSGEVRVTAQKADNSVTFCVEDTGIGIERDHLELIFEEFEQIHNPLQSQARGTGLGLPLSRRLAALLGGTVWVESEPGKGSKFYLRLPERAAVIEDVDTPMSSQVGNKLKVLVIDDDEVIRYVLQTRLESQKYQVLQATNGRDGLDLADASISSIFLDLAMKGLSGFEVLKSLKNDENTSGIPVIICTSMALSGKEIDQLKADGAARIVSKGDGFIFNAMGALSEVVKPEVAPG